MQSRVICFKCEGIGIHLRGKKMYDAENVFSMKIEKRNLFSKNCNDLWKMYTYFEIRIKKNL